jgi:iron complex transport system substrate-binding protein
MHRVWVAALAALFTAVTASDVRVQPGPRRIISLIPATTEMLYEMGAGGRLVAVSTYDEHPPEVQGLPKVGGLLDPNVERILAMRPDLVIVYDTQTELKAQLARAGVAMFNYTHRGLPDIAATLRQLGERIGMREAGAAAAQRLEHRLDAVRSRVAGRPRPRTLLVIGREPGSLRQISVSAGYGFLHDVLELAGGRDVLADVKRQSAEISTETILVRAPDVIIELHYGNAFDPSRTDAERRVWGALSSVPAVRNGRVHLLMGDEFVVPGPRIANAAERFAQVLHP